MMTLMMGKNKIIHEFYQKEVASKRVINANSALPIGQKFSILVEEGIRRLKATHRSKIDVLKKPVLQEFNYRMLKGGHSEPFRYQVTERILNKYKQMQIAEKEGKRKIHRNKEEMLKDKNENPSKKSKSDWFKKKTEADAKS